MRRNTQLPYQLDQRLDEFISARLRPSESRVPALYRETTRCIAYMCVYAYACSERAERPAQVLMRRCMRYMPERLRVKPKLSDHALDVLAAQRQAGVEHARETSAILDEHRPRGPLRRVA